ncbi:hypothetical protein IEO21_05786 [Rhodonia placenta]|uniref:Polynucleotide 5'-hydroxyl-kinase GRC3 n=1 Tax=Rhodonia placenta TaxID=104341 RepID=A0A8H7P162_9APHY|nr:hypothetical protein IEO21_05786 [Postia placenta]
MLSAVAARKARLEEKKPPADLSKPTSAPTSAPAQVSTLTPRPSLAQHPEGKSKPPLKRKSGEQGPKPSKKKRKQQGKPPGEKRPRYFEGDAFKTQEDLIVVPDDDSDTDASRSEIVQLRDSSDEEDDESGEDAAYSAELPSIYQPSRPAPDEPPVLSTFCPILDQNMFHLTEEEMKQCNLPSGQRGTLLVLSLGETLTLLGTCSLIVLHGSISLYGATLHASSTVHRVFAPRSSPLPVIESLSQTRHPRDISLALPSRIRAAATAGRAAVLLQDIQTGVEGLGLVCRTFDGVFAPSRWQSSSAVPDLGLNSVKLVAHHTRDLNPLLIPHSWEAATSSLLTRDVSTSGYASARLVCLVKGPKNAGKSTLARTLLNRLLTKYRRVAFLECDLGQSEFTPGGMAALNILDKPVFGPPFTHPSIPYAAHYIGAASPRSSPSHYLESIQALVQTYNLDVQHGALVEEQDVLDDRISDLIPLVVNTMGWTKGLGADLSRKVEELVEPSDIFDINPPSALYSAADHRFLSTMSYFHAVFTSDLKPPQTVMASSWDTTLPLCAQRPYEVDSQAAFDHVILTGAGVEDVVPSEVHRVLNGAIVALVRCDPGAVDIDADGSTDPTHVFRYRQGSAPPSPFSSNCCGLALVRSLPHSPPSPSMHLITPLPPHLLQSGRVLVKGELELPIWGMLDFRSIDNGDVAGVERSRVPFLKWGKSEAAGGERRRIRRNLMRKGQV